MKWICTTGGPLLLLEKRLAQKWRGISEPDDGSESDYGRACHCDDYLGTVAVGDREAVVFGDEPMQTAVLNLDSDRVYFVRWMYAESEERVAKHVESLSVDLFNSVEDLRFHAESDLLLFDSTLPGDELDNWLEVVVDPGEYRFRTCGWNPDSSTSLVLHLMERVSST